MSLPTLYGIPNCDSVRKARSWLTEKDIKYRFHDLRQDGLKPAQLQQWAAAVGWETLLNRRAQSWRKLPESSRAKLNETRALKLMHAEPTLIKRPLLEYGSRIHVGFNASEYWRIFK